MSDELQARTRELSDYLGVTYDVGADLPEVARAFGCDDAYVLAEPALPLAADHVLGRMGEALTDRDREEARRFAAYLLHATDD